MNLERIHKIAEEELLGKRSHPWKEPGNKFHHGERVARIALELRRAIVPDDDSHDEILTVAAWFHDVCNGARQHDLLGAERTRALLTGLCTDAELDEICGIIRVHDDRTRNPSFSCWVKLHQDADHLDHFGAYDVWMCILECGADSLTLPQAAQKLMARNFEELPPKREELNYELSRRLFDERVAFSQAFAARFESESRGEIRIPAALPPDSSAGDSF